MPAAKSDIYSQFMKLTVTMSAANTLTYSQVSLGAMLFDYAGLIIHRVEYFPDNDMVGEMTADADGIELAITGSDSIADLSVNHPEVYDKIMIHRCDIGAAGATMQMLFRPIVHDFNAMPGGGLLVPAQDVYIGMVTAGLASAGEATVRMWYTFKSLKAQDYFELAQRLRVLST